jgi:hypothetical protein
MLPQEKRRVAWSLGIGVVAAICVAGWTERQARHLDAQARVLVAKCEAKSKAGAPLPKGYEIACNPADFVPDNPPAQLTGPLKEVADIQSQAKTLHDEWPYQFVFVIAIFSLPLVWYLLLERVRELTAAFSGRDR